MPPLIALLTAAIFMQLPFYPVYGLCIPGQPLLVYSILCLYRPKNAEACGKLRGVLPPLLSVLLYSLCSSLVLVGFACLLVLCAAALCVTVRALKKKAALPWRLWLAPAVLAAGYLVSNLALLRQILFPAPGQISHKAEIVFTAEDFFISFRLYALRSLQYTACRWSAQFHARRSFWL